MTVSAAVARPLLQEPLPYEEARALLLARLSPLPPAEVAAADALGLACAETVAAGRDLPGFDNSAMDGFVVSAGDLAGASRAHPARLPLVGELRAGLVPQAPLPRGATMGITTGTPVPAGADAVVPWEATQSADGVVSFFAEVAPGECVRPRGEDVRAGTAVIHPGEVLTPAHLGVLAALGRTHVRARPQPRVAVLSTGDELVPPGARLGAGQLHDANSALLAGLCRQAGASVVERGLLGDDRTAVGAWLTGAARVADVVVASGGASVGEHDVVREVLTADHEVVFWRVAVKPGKPVAFATIAGTPVLALPGHPGTVAVCAHAFVLPALRALAGRDPAPTWVPARLARAVPGDATRTSFCAVRLEGDVAVPLPTRSSLVLSTLLPAQGFAVVPPHGLPQGAEVRVERLR